MIDKDTMGLLEGAIKGTGGMLSSNDDNSTPPAATSQPSSSTAYAADLYQRNDETFADYIQRMRTTREGGVLGTSSGMLSPVDYIKKAEEEKQKETVSSESSGSSTDGGEYTSGGEATNEQRYDLARFFYDNPNALSALGGLFGLPLGLLQSGINEYVDEYRNETRTTPSFWGSVFGDGSGDEVLGDSGQGSGSLVTGKVTSEADLRAEALKDDYFQQLMNEPSSSSGSSSSGTATSYPVSTSSGVTPGTGYSTGTPGTSSYGGNTSRGYNSGYGGW